MSLSRRPIVFGLFELFTICSSRNILQPSLKHPARIGRVRSPPQKSIVFPTDFDQLDQQLARNPIANFDTYNSHCMALIIWSGNRGIQSAFPLSAVVMARPCRRY